MPRARKNPPSLKAKVAVEAIKPHKTAARMAQVLGVRIEEAKAALPDRARNGSGPAKSRSGPCRFGPLTETAATSTLKASWK